MTTIALNYTILPEDSFSKIAAGLSKCKGMTEGQIIRANQGFIAGQFNTGDILNIPAASNDSIVLKYTIQPNDTLSDISNNINSAAGVTIEQIKAANPGIEPTKLHIGQLIQIPKSGLPVITTPIKTPMPIIKNEIVGYWDWTWDPGASVPGTNIGIAFSGWAEVTTAIQQSEEIREDLEGSPFICLGGGNENGAFTIDRLNAIIQAIEQDKFEGFSGIAFDVEEGDSNLESSFAQVFEKAQKAGYEVLVTVSHSAPFGISDGGALMHSFFSNKHIDILSPQLYTTGKETANDYSTSHNVQWSDYAGAIAMIAPSIVEADMYEDAVAFFASKGVKLNGYIQWNRYTGELS